MPRPMNDHEWADLERAAVAFCELRAEYRRRKAAGTLGEALEARLIQDLNALELHLERLKRGNELELARAGNPRRHKSSARMRATPLAKAAGH